MARQFQLQVFTQERKVLDEPATSIVVPGENGYFGVLADHAPLIANLGSGTLTIRREHAERTMNLSGGFIEVANNTVVILADKVTAVA